MIPVMSASPSRSVLVELAQYRASQAMQLGSYPDSATITAATATLLAQELQAAVPGARVDSIYHNMLAGRCVVHGMRIRISDHDDALLAAIRDFRCVPEDLYTHAGVWRQGLAELQRQASGTADAAYWRRELQIYDRVIQQLTGK